MNERDKYVAAMCGDHDESSTLGRDLAAIAESVLECYAARVYPTTSGSLSVGTRYNALISSEVCASILARNGGDFGAAAIALPAAIARALRLLDQSTIQIDCTADGVELLREFFRAL